jgi:hypothetical protein
MILSGELLGRYGEIGVFATRYRALIPHWYSYPLIIVENYFKHFSLQFLFIFGDRNLRHSTQQFGELGWLDILALMCGAALFVEFLIRRYRNLSEEIATYKSGLRICWWCAMTGFVPAALTWEGLPHALRSISVWPFWAIIAGCLLSRFVEKHSWMAPIVALVGLVFCATFLRVYFYGYPSETQTSYYFDVSHKQLAEEAKRT